MGANRAELANELAKTVGEGLLNSFHHRDPEFDIKSDRTLVTDADRAASASITRAIKMEFPEDGIVSEEEITVYPSQDVVWVIDPLDGTTNFTQGLHHWGVSIAYFIQGVPQYGSLYFPISGEHYTASSGGGAFLNGQPLRMDQTNQPQRFSFFVHCSRMHHRYQTSLPYKTRSLGSSAYHLCLVAKGTAVLAFESRAKLWDLAAGWLVVRESGGKIESFHDPAPFPAQVGLDYNNFNYSILAGTSQEVMEFARARIQRKISD